MEPISFYPGDEGSTEFPLERFLPPVQPGSIKNWLHDHVAQGSWVLDPFCSNPLLPLEAADAGYKVLVVCNNPILRLMLDVLSLAPQREDFQSVLSALGSARRGDERLEVFIQSLYLTECPNCNKQQPATNFIWKRDPRQMIIRTVHCPDCGCESQFAVLDTDLAKLTALEKSQAPAAWALQQLGDLTDDQKAIVKDAIDVYLPRTLYVLFSLINRSQGLNIPSQNMNLLLALLVSACDYGTALWQEKGGRAHPKQLSIPNEFIEYNLWQKMEESISAWSIRKEKVELRMFPDTPEGKNGICLYTGRLKSILPLDAGFSPSMVFASIPRPNQAFWTLSALWSGWLFGKDAVQPMHSALERQHYDWHWHTHALQPALSHILKTEPSEGFFGIQTEFTPGYALATLLASQISGWEVKGLSFQTEEDLLQLFLKQSAGSDSEKPKKPKIKEAINNLLSTVAEPLEYDQLFVCALQEMARSDGFIKDIGKIPMDYLSIIQSDLMEVLGDQDPFEQYGKGTFDSPRTWGVKTPKTGNVPFSEQFENEIIAQLRIKDSLSYSEIYKIVCGKFPGIIAPAGSLIKTILESYADPSSVSPGQWQLRTQDSSDHRQQDIHSVVSRLKTLSTSVGLKQVESEIIEWKDASGNPQWVFIITPTAGISRIIRGQFPVEADRRVLIVPGGRAGLISYRLKHDASLSEQIRGWHLVKFRHIKLLTERNDLNLQTWINLLDADPPSWGGAEQLTLLSNDS
jgi:hypothetical protein